MAVPDDWRATCQQLLDDAHARSPVPGILAATFTSDGILWEGHVGAVTRQYRIGSITKTFTAVAVLQLREARELDLDDPLARHVPDAPYGEATLRDLLSHSSGLTAEPIGPWWERTPGVPWDMLAELNGHPHHALPPRLAYHYSNLGYALLGEVVARQRGTTWYDAVRDKILGPLGLADTTYHPAVGAALGTSRHPRSGALVEEPAFDSVAMAAAGQLWSTLADLARWGTFLVEGRDDVLPGAVLKEMRTAASADPDTQHEGAYGFGLRLLWRAGSTLVGHTGSMPGFLAALFTDAASGVGAAVLTNATTGVAPEELASALVVRAATAARSESTPEVTPSAEPVGPATGLSGEWYWGNTEMTLRPTSAGFFLHTPNGVRTFAAVTAEEFVGLDGYFAGERLQVVRRSDGSVSHLEVVTFVLTREPYDPTAPIPGGVPQPLVSSPD